MSTPDAHELKGKTGLTRLRNALRYSRDGLRAAYTKEEAFRQELIVSLFGVPLALLLPVPLAEKLLCVFSLLFLLIVELLNSSIEATVDRVGLEIHPLAKQAKDMASAAVLFALIAVAVIWLCVLINAFVTALA